MGQTREPGRRIDAHDPVTQTNFGVDLSPGAGHEDVEHPERCGHRHAEVPRDQGMAVVSNEGGPALPGRAASSPADPAGHVAMHGARRDAEADLDQQLGGEHRPGPEAGPRNRTRSIQSLVTTRPR